MSEFLAMGGYGFYVWSSIGGFVLLLVLDWLTIRAQKSRVKRLLMSLRRKHKS